MQTVGDYVTHVSTQLNDQRPNRAFTRWGRGLLLEYLNLGLAEIGTYRPEAFAADIDLKLVPGALQSVAQGVSLSAIHSNKDGPPINRGDITMATAFGAYNPCRSSGISMVNGNAVFYVRSYSIDSADQRKFYVDPPVPPGIDVYVKATVMAGAEDYTLADWDEAVAISSKFKANLVDYMLACAYGLDQESPESRAHSDRLYRKFYEVMGVKYKQESRYRSGYYLGKVGTGDPQAGGR